MPNKNRSSLNLAWGEKTPPSRGPRPSLSAVRIARSALRIADTDGLEAVTMQRVAREVGVTTMALYRYFPGKADLVSLMIDSASEPAPRFGKASSLWDLRLKQWAHRCLAIYQDHPWFLEATSTRNSLMGPNELSWMEAALAMLAESGLSPMEQHHAFIAIIGHVRGHATFHQIAKHQSSGRRWVRDMVRNLEPEAGRFPRSLEVLGSGAFTQESGGAFDFGLECILDGIRAHETAHRAGTRRLK
jgi:AcrR family transcriptional regulator